MAGSLDEGVLGRARGAWLGQITGDALGTTVEFKTRERIAELHPGGLRQIVGGGPFSLLAGQVTDDTELALALARCLAGRGRYDPDAVASAYIAWYQSGPFDVGSTIGAAVGGRVDAGPGAAGRVARRASTASQSNGALMRLSPLAIWGWALPEDDLAALAAFEAQLTHPNPVCQAANVIHAHAIALAIREGTDARATYERTLAFARRHPACAPLVDALADAAMARPADYVRHMGWVRIALQSAFHALLHATTLEEGVVDTVMQGGDTDTNACIAGALLGAVHGERAIPAQWREAVLGCHTSRGFTYQAHDALQLAAALVKAGRQPGALPDLAAALAIPPDAEDLIDDEEYVDDLLVAHDAQVDDAEDPGDLDEDAEPLDDPHGPPPRGDAGPLFR